MQGGPRNGLSNLLLSNFFFWPNPIAAGGRGKGGGGGSGRRLKNRTLRAGFAFCRGVEVGTFAARLGRLTAIANADGALQERRFGGFAADDVSFAAMDRRRTQY